MPSPHTYFSWYLFKYLTNWRFFVQTVDDPSEKQTQSHSILYQTFLTHWSERVWLVRLILHCTHIHHKISHMFILIYADMYRLKPTTFYYFTCAFTAFHSSKWKQYVKNRHMDFCPVYVFQKWHTLWKRHDWSLIVHDLWSLCINLDLLVWEKAASQTQSQPEAPVNPSLYSVLVSLFSHIPPHPSSSLWKPWVCTLPLALLFHFSYCFPCYFAKAAFYLGLCLSFL